MEFPESNIGMWYYQKNKNYIGNSLSLLIFVSLTNFKILYWIIYVQVCYIIKFKLLLNLRWYVQIAICSYLCSGHVYSMTQWQLATMLSCHIGTFLWHCHVTLALFIMSSCHINIFKASVNDIYRVGKSSHHGLVGLGQHGLIYYCDG